MPSATRLSKQPEYPTVADQLDTAKHEIEQCAKEIQAILIRVQAILDTLA